MEYIFMAEKYSELSPSSVITFSGGEIFILGVPHYLLHSTVEKKHVQAEMHPM